MNYTLFFDEVRAKIFSGSLSQGQVDGLNVILDAMADFKDTILRNQAAYILATAFHETGATMQPVRETFATSDKKAMARLESAWQKGQLKWVKTPYWRTGWFGRGYVQLTHKANYKKMSDILGVDLVKDRDLALDEDVASSILVEGMMRGVSGKGDFTAYKLEDFVNRDTTDYLEARRVINGKESASKVKSHARKFEDALEKAGFATADDLKDIAPQETTDDSEEGTLSELHERIAALEDLIKSVVRKS